MIVYPQCAVTVYSTTTRGRSYSLSYTIDRRLKKNNIETIRTRFPAHRHKKSPVSYFLNLFSTGKTALCFSFFRHICRSITIARRSLVVVLQMCFRVYRWLSYSISSVRVGKAKRKFGRRSTSCAFPCRCQRCRHAKRRRNMPRARDCVARLFMHFFSRHFRFLHFIIFSRF